MFDLTGRTALVTGASGGIGSAIARGLHRQGAVVAISGRRPEALDQLAAELKERVHALPANLAERQEAETLVPQAEERMGKLDILVANAGITRDNLFVQLSDEAWDQVIAVDLTASFRLARAAIRGMRIPVSVIVGQIAHGVSHEKILQDYPDLERRDIQQEHAAAVDLGDFRLGLKVH